MVRPWFGKEVLADAVEREMFGGSLGFVTESCMLEPGMDGPSRRQAGRAFGFGERQVYPSLYGK